MNDINLLLLNTEKVNQNFYAFEVDVSKIATFEHNDLINDGHIEHIRRFNATATHLVKSLIQVQKLGQLLSEKPETNTIKGNLIDICSEHRFACRDAIINMDIYIEAVKSFCRYYFFMDPKKTDSSENWCKALMNYKAMNGWDLIDAFINQCLIIKTDKITNYLINVRNSEVHSESPLELIKYEFREALIPVPLEYVISNQDLHNYLVHSISLLITLTQNLQNIINQISPERIYNYLKNKNGKLHLLIKMEDRYKNERKVFSDHSTLLLQ